MKNENSLCHQSIPWTDIYSIVGQFLNESIGKIGQPAQSKNKLFL